MRIRKIVVSPYEALLILTTIAALGAMTGALYGAAKAQRQEALNDCESRTQKHCVIVAIPLDTP